MSAPDVPLAPDQMQALVVHGYVHDYCDYFVLTIDNRANAQAFLAQLLAAQRIKPAAHEKATHRPDEIAVSVAFTYTGLQALGLRQSFLNVLDKHAPAFSEGAHCRAASRLADTGESAPRYWHERFARDAAHVLLAVHGDEQKALDVLKTQLMQQAGSAFTDAGWRQPFRTGHLQPRAIARQRKVHFGFIDGISKIYIKGLKGHEERDREYKTFHAAGEFVLGYPNDEGYNPWLLANEPVDPCVPPREPGEERRPRVLSAADFFRNGSFAALRDIEQDEVAFDRYITEWAGHLQVKPAYVKAKMLGRWDNGAVVESTHSQAPSAVNEKLLDYFDFVADPLGHGCPFGSHVRRMNPRGDGVVPFRRRPVIRRGMPYGAAWNGDPKDETPRGLMGMFICASLEEQFEHLIAEWGDANPMGTPNKGGAKDPIIGNHANAGAVFDIPTKSDSLRRLEDLCPFVTTRGTLYLFFPGIAVLENLANRNVFLS